MSDKKKRKLDGPLLDNPPPRRNSPVSTLARAAERRREAGMLDDEGKPWQQWENDLILKHRSEGLQEKSLKFIKRSRNAINQRAQALIGGKVPFVPGPGWLEARVHVKEWGDYDRWCLDCIFEPKARNKYGKCTAQNLANATGRTVEQVLPHFKMRERQEIKKQKK